MKKFMKKFAYLGAALGLLASNIGGVGQVSAVDGTVDSTTNITYVYSDQCKVGKNVNDAIKGEVGHAKVTTKGGQLAFAEGDPYKINDHESVLVQFQIMISH